MEPQSLKWTFDTVADAYEAVRPGYTEEVFSCILDYCPLTESGRALEIGIGAGAATVPFLQTGCSLTAVEYGNRFCELCREKFRSWPRFAVIHDSFETAALPESSFDLVYSASAFHWIHEKTGYQKVFSLLKEGGTFARFAIHTSYTRENSPLSEEIRQIYEKYYAISYGAMPAPFEPFDRRKAAAIAASAERYGFTDICVTLFDRIRNLTAEEFLALIGTYSDNVAMTEEIRQAFFSEVKSALLRHGGRISLYDVIDLELARKPFSTVPAHRAVDEE